MERRTEQPGVPGGTEKSRRPAADLSSPGRGGASVLGSVGIHNDRGEAGQKEEAEQ